MSDLRDLLERGARDVPEPHWAPASQLRAAGHRRAVRQRVGLVAVGVAAAVVVASIATGTVGFGQPGAAPVGPLEGCLTGGHGSAVPASPYTVLVGGRQLLSVPLSTGRADALGRCQAPRIFDWIAPGNGARALTTQDEFPSVFSLKDGHPVQAPVSRGRGVFAAGAGGSLLRVQWIAGQAQLDWFVGQQPLSTARASAYDVFGETSAGVVALGGSDNATLELLDRVSGATTRTLGRTQYVLGVGSDRVIWVPIPEFGDDPVTWNYGIPQRCLETCEIRVTNTVTGNTTPISTGDLVWAEAAFSPDGRTVALASADPGSGALITLLDLSTGKLRTISGIHNITSLNHGPALAWTPDSKAVVIADATSQGARLLVWSLAHASPTKATTLRGDASGIQISVADTAPRS